MGKGRQPPKLLSRVLRTVAELHESKGSSVAHIADHIKKELTENGTLRRNVALEIRRALKYAVNIGALRVKSGKYRSADHRRVIPIDSAEIRIKKTKRKYIARKKCVPRVPRKHGGRCVRDTDKKKKTIKRRRRVKKQSNAPDSKREKHPQPLRQESTPASPPYSGTDKEDKESSYAPSQTPGPHDKTQDLDKKKNIKGQDERHQTSYPEYNDTMNGDDKKDLNKLRGRTRRPRRPILPTTQNLIDGDPDFADPTNGKMSRSSESSRSLHLHHSNVPRKKDRNGKKKNKPLNMDATMEIDPYFY